MYKRQDQTYCPDGILAAARIVEIAAERTLSELRKEIPKYPTLRSSISFDPSRKDEVLEMLRIEMSSVECQELVTLDGFRHQFEDGWTLVRPSGTEPKIRIMAEARDGAQAGKLLEAMTKIVRGCVA